MRKILFGAGLGAIGYLTLGLFPYFPQWWIIVFGLLTAALYQKHSELTAVLVSLVTCLVISYHSFYIFILYFLAAVIFTLACYRSDWFEEMYVILFGAPFLAAISLGSFTLPLEFLAIFLSARLLKGKKIPAIASLSCLWCVMAGAIGQQTVIGNLLIGPSTFPAIILKNAPGDFYNFGWVINRIMSFSPGMLEKILVGIRDVLAQRPAVWLAQIFGWGLSAYLVGLLVNQKKLLLRILGAAATIGLVIICQLLSVGLFGPEVRFDFGRFAVIVLAAVVVVYAFCEIFELNSDAQGEAGDPLPVSTRNKWVFGRREKPQIIQHTVDVSEVLRSQRLSLEDSLKIKKSLNDYIKQKFEHEVTVLNIDVVDSTKLKFNHTEENIIFSFSEYWRAVDSATWAHQGRMLNRSGDGAVYVFTNADEAVLSSQDILKAVDKFNKRVNALKQPFNIRMGINTGRIVEDTVKTGGDVFSRVLDIAAHLQEVAAPGETFISGNTYEKLARTAKNVEEAGFLERDNVKIYKYKGKG